MTTRRATALAAILACSAAFTGCVKSEIEPLSKDTPPDAVETPVADADAPTAPAGWTVLRVGGDPDAGLTVTPGETTAGDRAPYYQAGDAKISAALAEGYAPPTPPGAIELKVYEPYRQAVVETAGGQNGAFWPLFRHISSRDIAMTSPVVMTGRMAGEDTDESTMAFLYRTPELGPTGAAERGVTVEDTERTTVLAVGFQGRDSGDALDRAERALLGWLDAQDTDAQGVWVATDGPRLLGYNGPDVPTKNKWWELQIPVRWNGATP